MNKTSGFRSGIISAIARLVFLICFALIAGGVVGLLYLYLCQSLGG